MSERQRFYDIFRDISQDAFTNIAKVEPKCALCRKPVEKFMQAKDIATKNAVFTVQCHGKEEQRFVADYLLLNLNVGVVDFLSEWFKEDSDKIVYSFISGVSSSYASPSPPFNAKFINNTVEGGPILGLRGIGPWTTDERPKLKQEKPSSISLQPKKRMVGFE